MSKPAGITSTNSGASLHPRLEAVSKLFVAVLQSKIDDSKAPCAGNSGAIFKHGNAASADSRLQPEGPGPLFRISALLAAR